MTNENEQLETTPAEQEILGAEKLRKQILHIFSIYPVISPTMLQGGLGPYSRPADWKPILEQLIEEGLVVREHEELQTPAGRYNTYTKLRLVNQEQQQEDAA